jgi:predicted DNA-binding antitoxin AbrB/MazE fold protein
MEMSLVIRAHYDGRVIVPDEPVDLPVGQPLEVELRLIPTEIERSQDELSIEERQRRLAQASGRISGPLIPLEALRRENLYEERA